MVVLIQTGLPKLYDDVIKSGIPKKWNSPYHFLQLAAKEKLEREGLISEDELTFIHYHCPHCNRELYVSPEVAGLFEWLYCTNCYKVPPPKSASLIRKETILGKDIPKGSDIRRW